MMLDIALNLAVKDSSYEDMASKFFEHFVSIVDAMNNLGGMLILTLKLNFSSIVLFMTRFAVSMVISTHQVNYH